MAVKFKSDNIQKHQDLSNKIKDGLDVKGNTVSEKEPHSCYYANLPENVTKSTVEEISKYNSKFVTAAHVAVGEVAADIFKKDKSVLEVNAHIGFFGKSDSIDIDVSRSKKYQNHLAEKDEDKEVTKHLVMKTTVETQSTKGLGLKSVRASMSEEFRDSFSK